MKVIFWLAKVHAPPLKDAAYIVEASRPSTALARVARMLEDSGKGVPRLTSKKRFPHWGSIDIYRFPPEQLPAFRGKKINSHVWEAIGEW